MNDKITTNMQCNIHLHSNLKRSMYLFIRDHNFVINRMRGRFVCNLIQNPIIKVVAAVQNT